MPMKISDGDLLIAEDWLNGRHVLPHLHSRAKDVVLLALEQFKNRQRMMQRSEALARTQRTLRDLP